MVIHPYHYQLMRCLIRFHVKGDHRIPLTCADRTELVDSLNLTISKSSIVKVLSEGQKARKEVSQHVLDQLMRCINYTNWNSFLQKNPVPKGEYYILLRAKSRKKLLQAVEERMLELMPLNT